MELSSNIKWRMILFSMVIVILPMLYFPELFGMELIKPSIINLFYEMIFYGSIIYLFYRQVTLINLLQACGACVIYRLATGAALGLLLSLMYNLKIDIAVTMATSSYLPSILLQILVTPFILKPAISGIYIPKREKRTEPRRSSSRPLLASKEQGSSKTNDRSKAVPKRKKRSNVVFTQSSYQSKDTQPVVQNFESKTENTTTPKSSNENGFDQAVHYVAEHSAVEMIGLIDHEGLLISNFTKTGELVEDVAPLAELFQTYNEEILARCGLGQTEKIDLILQNKRLIVTSIGPFTLMVIADRQSDDFLNIRINQSVEMISRYTTERYDNKTVTVTEKEYV